MTILVIAVGAVIVMVIIHMSVRSLTDNETIRRWVLRFMIGGTLIAVLLVAAVWLHLGGVEGSSASRIKALQALGLPTNGTELNDYYALPPGATDDTPAWDAALSALMEVELPRDQLARLPIVGFRPLDVLQRGDDWSQQPDVERLLEQQDQRLTELRSVALRGGYTRFPVDFSPRPLQAKLDYLPRLRNGARWLSLSAIHHAWQQDAGSLGDDLTALVSLSRANQQDPVLISSLVNGAVFGQWFDSLRRAARLCPLSAEDCIRMQQMLLEMDFEHQMLRAVRGERAMGLTELDVIRSPLVVESRRAYLDYLEYHELLMQNPSDPALEEMQEVLSLGQKRLFGKQRFFAVLLLAPALQQSIESMRELEARRRIGLLALAARRFQLEHGELPARAEQLADWLPTGTVEGLLTDPCCDQPFVLQATDKGLLIYSPGRDGVDDGGQIERTLTGDDERPPADIGIRLPSLK